MFLPSLLEYSELSLVKKIKFINQNLEAYKQASFQDKSLFLHLDCVEKNFAIERKIMQSLSFLTVLTSILDNNLNDFNLSCHFMQSNLDFKNLWSYLDFIKANILSLKNLNIKFIFYVDQNYYKAVKNYIKKLSLNSCIKLGIWLDLDFWTDDERLNSIDKKLFKEAKYYLLMSVKAGLSGQSLIPETISKYKQICTIFSKKDILMDGGINFTNYLLFDTKNNINFVSYKAFWSQFQSI